MPNEVRIVKSIVGMYIAVSEVNDEAIECSENLPWLEKWIRVNGFSLTRILARHQASEVMVA